MLRCCCSRAGCSRAALQSAECRRPLAAQRHSLAHEWGCIKRPKTPSMARRPTQTRGCPGVRLGWTCEYVGVRGAAAVFQLLEPHQVRRLWVLWHHAERVEAQVAGDHGRVGPLSKPEPVPPSAAVGVARALDDAHGGEALRDDAGVRLCERACGRVRRMGVRERACLRASASDEE